MYEPPREENGKMTGGESPSAYASAESSPLQSLQSFSSLKQAEEMAGGHAKGGLVSSSSAVGIATLGKVEYDQANGLLLNEYQSLPPNLTGNESVKEIIEKTVKSSMEEIGANKKSPKTSPETTTQRSSMLSLLGRMFQKSDSSKKKETTATTLPSVSSSSPNPENSPYKLLAAKPQPQAEHLEKLAALNHKEHEKVDPILSSASIKLVDSETSKLSSQHAVTGSNGGAMAGAAAAGGEPSAPTTKCMPVPASSHEFCMDLNLNLAAAASADLTDHKTTSNTSPQQQCDHNRFTKNASTSSIHNDLKLILEEGKEKSPTTAPTAKSATAVEQKNKDEGKTTEAKPQRDRSHKSSSSKHGKHSKHSAKNHHQQQQQSQLSKMLTEMDNEKRRSSGDHNNLKQSTMPPNRHRYSKELLTRINNERATLIGTIFPEIFKTYSCCMTGKHWDPEKYFDIVQFTSNERSQPMKPNYKNRTPRINNNNINNNNNNNNNNYYKKQNYNNNQYHNNSNSFNRQNRSYNQNRGSSSVEAAANNVDVDRMLLNMVKSKQATIQTPSVNLMDILNKKQHTTNIIGDLFAASTQQHDMPASNAPKHYPRILTAQELELSQLCTGAAGLMQQLQKSSSSSSKTPDRSSAGLNSLSLQRMNNSLESCGSPSGSSTSSSSRISIHNHHPHQHHNHHVNTDLDNSSDAYKQLVKNLSNHPLSAATQPSKCSDIDQLLLKLNDGANRPRAENPTQHLKKLLHLDSHQSKPANKPRHHHNHHQRKSKPAAQETHNAMDELMLKLTQKTPTPMVNQNTEQDHFNGLINKLIPSLANHIPTGGQKHSTSNNDILKWFKEPNAV